MFWRILIFYVLAIFVIGMLIPYTDPRLLNSNVNQISVSPFTLVFERAGFAFAAGVMNAVILTAVLSAGNSAVYASARMLWALAKDGKAPKVFAKVTSRGVPVNALIVNVLFALASLLLSFLGHQAVYTWMLNASGLTGFIAWLGISVSHYRFRRAYIKQGRDVKDLAYRAKWYPFGPIFAIVLCLVIVIGQDCSAFTDGSIDWKGIAATYIGIPLFLALWFGYKWTKKTKVVPLDACDFRRVES
ncbi:hypothetical protein GCM10025859_40760 [Alicyclobacillus fastidiosus]|nr:hypothetical protein GCM10025859_40760 [Alicyclobacillus fastidiosus]